jgi:transaldolase
MAESGSSLSALDQLKQYTTVVADTGDVNAIAQYKPQDATTNPSLILKAAAMPEYAHLFDEAILYGTQHGKSQDQQVEFAFERLYILFGKEILKHIPGRVSIEVDPRYSFCSEDTIDAAEEFISAFEEEGINRERILIKVASTWQGMSAIKYLENQGIHTNATLIFSYAQALAAAQAGATLISPFVGRITDWYKKSKGVAGFDPEEDPGVLSVRQIYNLFKKYGYNTEVMGASFRSSAQVLALAGCDLLTISPEYLNELQGMEKEVPRVLSVENAGSSDVSLSSEELALGRALFDWIMCQDAMATDLLADGIRKFNKDARNLEDLIKKRMAA